MKIGQGKEGRLFGRGMWRKCECGRLQVPGDQGRNSAPQAGSEAGVSAAGLSVEILTIRMPRYLRQGPTASFFNACVHIRNQQWGMCGASWFIQSMIQVTIQWCN